MAEKIKRIRIAEVDNPFAKGVLLDLKVCCWGGVSKLNQDFFSGTLTVDEKKKVRAVYDLLEKNTELRHLHEMRDEANRWVRNPYNSLPSTTYGMVFIYKNKIEDVNNALERRREEFMDKIDGLCAVYSDRKDHFAENNPHLYDSTKYPHVSELRSRFKFHWSFKHFSVPDESLGLLSPEIYAEEERKYKAEMAEMRNLAVSTIGNQFIEKIKTLKDQCLGDKVSGSTVNSLKEWMDTFEAQWKDYVGHKELSRMVSQAKDYLVGIGAPELRADDSFRDMVGKKMEDITNHFDTIADARLRRKLDV